MACRQPGPRALSWQNVFSLLAVSAYFNVKIRFWYFIRDELYEILQPVNTRVLL